MQPLPYLFILALALGAACGSDSEKNEEPAQDTIETTDTLHRASAAQGRQPDTNKADTLYRISGTEPFWSLTIARPRSVYTPADGDTLFFDFKEPRTASARQQEHVQVFELGSEQLLVLRKTGPNCPCSDGMSGKSYPYQATLMLAEKVLDGCGEKLEAGN